MAGRSSKEAEEGFKTTVAEDLRMAEQQQQMETTRPSNASLISPTLSRPFAVSLSLSLAVPLQRKVTAVESDASPVQTCRVREGMGGISIIAPPEAVEGSGGSGTLGGHVHQWAAAPSSLTLTAAEPVWHDSWIRFRCSGLNHQRCQRTHKYLILLWSVPIWYLPT